VYAKVPEWRLESYMQSIFRRGDISLMCPTPSILQYAIAQLGQNALHVKNRTTEDGWVKSYFCPPAEVCSSCSTCLGRVTRECRMRYYSTVY
jgi:hypothetical protein